MTNPDVILSSQQKAVEISNEFVIPLFQVTAVAGGATVVGGYGVFSEVGQEKVSGTENSYLSGRRGKVGKFWLTRSVASLEFELDT